MIRPTHDNMELHAEPALAQWLIEAAHNRTDLPYGLAMRRLEKEVGFSAIGRATNLGRPAGGLMHRIQKQYPDAPLLNTLLVLQADRLPSDGAGSFLASRYGRAKLAKKGERIRHPEKWRQYSEKAISEVYRYEDWVSVFENVFDQPFSGSGGELDALTTGTGKEKDGQKVIGGGEGPQHRALRLLIQAKPDLVFRRLLGKRTETEVLLKSADRVDVVCYGQTETVAIEVKSRISDEVDFERGIYQCVKYKAILEAMDPRMSSQVTSVLVTEGNLPGSLSDLARRLGVTHRIVRLEDS